MCRFTLWFYEGKYPISISSKSCTFLRLIACPKNCSPFVSAGCLQNSSSCTKVVELTSLGMNYGDTMEFYKS